MKLSPVLSYTAEDDKLDPRVNRKTGSKWDEKVMGTGDLALPDLRYKVGEAVYAAVEAVTRTDEWKKARGREARMKMIADARAAAVKEQAELTGMSPSFVRKWSGIFIGGKRRYAKDPSFRGHFKESFKSVSNRPLVILKRISEEVRMAIVRIREKYPTMGSAKIRQKLIEDDVEPPCCRTIDTVLRSFSLLDDPVKRAMDAEPIRFERDEANDLWQIDYKMWAYGVHSIWVLDDCSRAILSYRVDENQSAKNVIELLEWTIKIQGKPKQILSDNGPEFTSWCGVSQLDTWCKENGIEHINGRPYHPQTQGKIERSHATATKEMPMFGTTETLEKAREAIPKWIQFYNIERPHQAIDQDYPLIRYITMHPRSGDLFLESLC